MLAGVIVVAMASSSQAATIILKDGRKITGEITQQDKMKLIIKEGGSTLTYYKDEIVSIDGKSEDAGKINKPEAPKDQVPADPEKEKLATSLLTFLPPSENIMMDMVGHRIPADQKDQFIAFVKKDGGLQKLMDLRIQGHEKYFSSASLKAMIEFFSSPNGQAYIKEAQDYQKNETPEIRKIIYYEVTSWMESQAKKTKH